MTERPLIRASHCKGTLRSLQALAPAEVGPVLLALPRELRDGLAAATGLDLVPAEWDVRLVEAIEARLEAAQARLVYRTTMREALTGSLLGSLVAGGLRVFGGSPAGLYGWAGRAFAHVCRGCGELRLVSAGETTAELALVGMPASLAVPAYLEAIGATMEAVLDVCRVEGAVRTTPEPGGARFRVRWAAG